MNKDIKNTLLSGINPELVNRLSSELDERQLLWLSGYLYGLASSHNGQALPNKSAENSIKTAAIERPKLTILYGSQSGNSKKIATKAAKEISNIGYETLLLDMNEYNNRQLSQETHMIIVVATYGEGDPPIAAESLYNYIHSSRAPKLDKLSYSILALGDKSYAHFCKTGIDFDKQLSALGAKPIVARVDCDTDYEEQAHQWIHNLVSYYNDLAGTYVQADQVIDNPLTSDETEAPKIVYDRKNPYTATVLEKILLNGRGSQKETWHIEIDLGDSGLTYQPGDSLGIYPTNPGSLVNEILMHINLSGDNTVYIDGEKMSFRKALTHKKELNLLHRDLLLKLAEKKNNPLLENILASTDQLKDYIYGRDLLDLLKDAPKAWMAQDLIDLLRPIQPRLYSISSSQAYTGNEVHITVSAVRYNYTGRDKKGAASTFLADQINIGDPLEIFFEENEYFKLPKEDRPIIMIGPGTGIAPFRAFIQEREVNEQKASAWLFFGNPHFTTDFLYQTEWQKALKNGVLHKLDLAFSRDTPEKIYVQHKLKNNAAQLIEWIHNGAYIYVCGDKNKMATDVYNTLIEIVKEQLNYDDEKAAEYVKDLKRNRRYLEDVY